MVFAHESVEIGTLAEQLSTLSPYIKRSRESEIVVSCKLSAMGITATWPYVLVPTTVRDSADTDKQGSHCSLNSFTITSHS